jgi:hypothetical protein
MFGGLLSGLMGTTMTSATTGAPRVGADKILNDDTRGVEKESEKGLIPVLYSVLGVTVDSGRASAGPTRTSESAELLLSEMTAGVMCNTNTDCAQYYVKPETKDDETAQAVADAASAPVAERPDYSVPTYTGPKMVLSVDVRGMYARKQEQGNVEFEKNLYKGALQGSSDRRTEKGMMSTSGDDMFEKLLEKGGKNSQENMNFRKPGFDDSEAMSRLPEQEGMQVGGKEKKTLRRLSPSGVAVASGLARLLTGNSGANKKSLVRMMRERSHFAVTQKRERALEMISANSVPHIEFRKGLVLSDGDNFDEVDAESIK